MSETMIKSAAAAKTTLPTGKNPLQAMAIAAPEFSNLLQAFDAALPSGGNLMEPPASHNAPQNEATNDDDGSDDRASTKAEPSTPVKGKAARKSDEAAPRAAARPAAARAEKSAERNDCSETGDSAPAAEMPETGAPDEAAVMELPEAKETPAPQASTTPAKAAAVNLLAGEQQAAQVPKIVASQKATPTPAVANAAATVAASAVASTPSPDSAVTAKPQSEAEIVPQVTADMPQPDKAKDVKGTPVMPLPALRQTAAETGKAADAGLTLPAGMTPLDRPETLSNFKLPDAAQAASGRNASEPVAPPMGIVPTAAAAPTAANTAAMLAGGLQNAARMADPQAAAANKSSDHAAALQMLEGNKTGALGTYSGTTQLTAARTARSAALSAADVVEQVSVKLNQQAKSGLDQLTIQLRPTDLGRIDIKLQFHDGAVSGTIIADSQATLDLLAKDQRSLERALQDSGLRTDSGSLSFQLRDQSQQSAAQEQSRKQNGKSATFDLTPAAADESAAAEEIIISADRVNLRV